MDAYEIQFSDLYLNARINFIQMRIKTSNLRREVLLFPPSLEELVSEENIVRLLDAFVNHLDIESHGFKINHKNKRDAGAPQYAPSDLLKIYLYGYINRTRSSRQLARCCQINVEMMWLINGLAPGHVTIANFRKNNPKALKQVFRTYNRFLNEQGLFGKKTVAVDSSKFRAQNSKKNNFSDRSIMRHQKYNDNKTEEYLALLDQSDQAEKQEKSIAQIKERLEQLAARKKKYGKLKAELDKAKEQGQKQISTVDADARLLTSAGRKGIVGYNVQSAVDHKHCLIAENEVTNTGDQNALYNMVSKTKDVLEIDELKEIDVLADAAYDNGEELMKCASQNIVTYVAPRNRCSAQNESKFTKDNFIYNKDQDTYTCPTDHVLVTNGKYYTNKRKGKKAFKYKKYKLEFSKCNACEFKEKCALKWLEKKQGKLIQRREYSDYVEANQQRVKQNKDYYYARQAIVEHPFGTIKRQWGYSYTLLKGKEKVGGEFDLICLSYNIRRSVSILGVKELIRALEAFKNVFSCIIKQNITNFKPIWVSKTKIVGS